MTCYYCMKNRHIARELLERPIAKEKIDDIAEGKEGGNRKK